MLNVRNVPRKECVARLLPRPQPKLPNKIPVRCGDRQLRALIMPNKFSKAIRKPWLQVWNPKCLNLVNSSNSNAPPSDLRQTSPEILSSVVLLHLQVPETRMLPVTSATLSILRRLKMQRRVKILWQAMITTRCNPSWIQSHYRSTRIDS